eukprot:PhM_4_TR17350/c0_g1_i1/m.98391
MATEVKEPSKDTPAAEQPPALVAPTPAAPPLDVTDRAVPLEAYLEAVLAQQHIADVVEYLKQHRPAPTAWVPRAIATLQGPRERLIASLTARVCLHPADAAMSTINIAITSLSGTKVSADVVLTERPDDAVRQVATLNAQIAAAVSYKDPHVSRQAVNDRVLTDTNHECIVPVETGVLRAVSALVLRLGATDRVHGIEDEAFGPRPLPLWYALRLMRRVSVHEAPSTPCVPVLPSDAAADASYRSESILEEMEATMNATTNDDHPATDEVGEGSAVVVETSRRRVARSAPARWKRMSELQMLSSAPYRARHPFDAVAMDEIHALTRTQVPGRDVVAAHIADPTTDLISPVSYPTMTDLLLAIVVDPKAEVGGSQRAHPSVVLDAAFGSGHGVGELAVHIAFGVGARHVLLPPTSDRDSYSVYNEYIRVVEEVAALPPI